jgi:hypothetical protein
MYRRYLGAFAVVVATLTAAPRVLLSAAPSRAVATLGTINLKLAASGAAYRVAKLETITAPASGETGATVFAKDVGNRQLAFHFVPALLRFASVAPNVLVYAIDTKENTATGGLGGAATAGAIDRAMATWASQSCAPIPMGRITNLPPGTDLGIIQNTLGFGGSQAYVADVVHAGWLPGAFFDAISDDGAGSTYILGVTFTLIWVDAAGNPVDSNHDHKGDAAIREVYYNNAFSWTNDVVDFTSPFIDTESIALHESGHALSQEHFGKVFNDGFGTKTPGFQLDHLHFAPRAVMNAIYFDTQRSPLGTDSAGHCEIWSTWGK